MKKLLFIPAIVLGLAACNTASDKDYENMTTDLCECMNSSTEGLSDDMKNTLIDAGKNGEDIQAAIEKLAMDKPMQTMQDGQLLMQIGEDMQNGCLKDLEKKYENVYTLESEADVQKKIVETMEGKDGCGLTYAILKMALDNQ